MKTNLTNFTLTFELLSVFLAILMTFILTYSLLVPSSMSSLQLILLAFFLLILAEILIIFLHIIMVALNLKKANLTWDEVPRGIQKEIRNKRLHAFAIVVILNFIPIMLALIGGPDKARGLILFFSFLFLLSLLASILLIFDKPFNPYELALFAEFNKAFQKTDFELGFIEKFAIFINPEMSCLIITNKGTFEAFIFKGMLPPEAPNGIQYKITETKEIEKTKTFTVKLMKVQLTMERMVSGRRGVRLHPFRLIVGGTLFVTITVSPSKQPKEFASHTLKKIYEVWNKYKDTLKEPAVYDL